MRFGIVAAFPILLIGLRFFTPEEIDQAKRLWQDWPRRASLGEQQALASDAGDILWSTRG